MTATIWDPNGDVLPLVNASGTLLKQEFALADGPTTFTLTDFAYVVGTNSLQIYRDGSLLTSGRDFTELTSTTFSIVEPLQDATETLTVFGFVGITGVATNALLVGIQDVGGYFASTNVEGALQEVGADLGAVSSNRNPKNYIYNGAFELARDIGPVALTTSAEAKCCDNWYAFQNTAAASTISQVVSTLANTNFALKLQRNAASASVNEIIAIRTVPSVDAIALAGKEIVFTFAVKAGVNFSGANVNVALFTGTGIDENPGMISAWTGVQSPIATTKPVTTSWVRHSISTTLPANATEIGVRFFFSPSGVAGADDSLQLTIVDLREGNEAQNYESRIYQEDVLFNRIIPIQCGRLSNLLTATSPIPMQDPFDSCHFIPYNGNLVMISGKAYVIPDGALAASGGIIARYSDCYVDRVPNQTLADGTFYYIYLCVINRVVVMNFSTTYYLQNGALYGNAVKFDDPDSTLIGICRIKYVAGIPTTFGGARGQTISGYFNQFRATLEGSVVAAGITDNTPVAFPGGAALPNSQPTDNFCEWVQWYDNAPRITAFFNASNSRASNFVNVGIGLNSTTVISGHTAIAQAQTTAANSLNMTARAAPSDATGYFYAQMIGYETENGGAGSISAAGRFHVDGVVL